jgi:hypothetical protein
MNEVRSLYPWVSTSDDYEFDLMMMYRLQSNPARFFVRLYIIL